MTKYGHSIVGFVRVLLEEFPGAKVDEMVRASYKWPFTSPDISGKERRLAMELGFTEDELDAFLEQRRDSLLRENAELRKDLERVKRLWNEDKVLLYDALRSNERYRETFAELI